MRTTVKEIFDNFSNKITDYKILELEDEDVHTMCLMWLKSAIAHQKKIDHDFTIDESIEEFVEELNDTEKELLSLGMVIEWLRPQIYSTDLTSQFIAGKEEKFYAQSTHLNALKDLLKETRLEKNRLAKGYGYRNNRYLNPNS